LTFDANFTFWFFSRALSGAVFVVPVRLLRKVCNVEIKMYFYT